MGFYGFFACTVHTYDENQFCKHYKLTIGAMVRDRCRIPTNGMQTDAGDCVECFVSLRGGSPGQVARAHCTGCIISRSTVDEWSTELKVLPDTKKMSQRSISSVSQYCFHNTLQTSSKIIIGMCLGILFCTTEDANWPDVEYTPYKYLPEKNSGCYYIGRWAGRSG